MSQRKTRFMIKGEIVEKRRVEREGPSSLLCISLIRTGLLYPALTALISDTAHTHITHARIKD